MVPITQFLGLFALIIFSLTTTATAAPLSTFTTCTTTTITPPPSGGVTTTETVGATSTSLTLTTTTITMPSSTTTSYTTVTVPIPTGTMVPEYGQCGGLGYAGPTTCEIPFVCVCTSDWWCQCRAPTLWDFEQGINIPNTVNADETSPAFHPNPRSSTYRSAEGEWL